MIRAAAIARKQYLETIKNQHPKATNEINKKLSTMPVTDIKDLAQKLVAKRQKDSAQIIKDAHFDKNNDLT